MSTLAEAYRVASETPSDINQHVPCLRLLAEQCEHATEFGVRHGVSTTALLAGTIHGRLTQLVSYDIVRSQQVDSLYSLVPEGVFQFVQASSTVAPIVATDMLFIDSLHTRAQLTLELLLHHRQVRRWIVLHDTELFGTTGEGSPEGLLPAIRGFLRAQSCWCVAEHYPHNNGLTVLSRVVP